jgi:hypothetical protein
MTGRLPTDDDKHPRVDEDAYDPEDPGESKAGRGGVVSPGGKQPKPTEDPRKDAGLEPEATPKD